MEVAVDPLYVPLLLVCQRLVEFVCLRMSEGVFFVVKPVLVHVRWQNIRMGMTNTEYRWSAVLLINVDD